VDSFVQSVQVQRDGRIVLAGSAGSTQQWAVARLTSSGALDTSFATAGKAVLAVGQSGSVSALRFQDWGGLEYPILAGGSETCLNAPGQMAVLRLRPDGSVDSTFGPNGNGRAFVDLGGYTDSADDLVVDAGNRILLAGYSFSHLALARLSPGGTIDPTFGTGGATLVDIAGKQRSHATRVLLDGVGRVVVGGYTDPPTGQDSSFLAARFLDDGTPDASFGGAGAVVTDFGFGTGWDVASGIAIQPDGRIALAGVATVSYVGLAGYTP
jgi:uncharacterized delta-60 repeat protein